MIRLAVSTICFKDRSLRDALECVAEAGCRNVELVALGQVHVDVMQTNAMELGVALGAAGVDLAALYPRPIDVAGEEQLGGTVAQVCRAVDLADELGCGRIVFSPLIPREDYDYERLMAGCRQVAEHIGERDVCVCLENHANWPLSDADDYARIEELFADPRIAITADTGHFSTVGVDLVAFAERFGPAIRHVHLKDRVGPEAVAFGTGETDNAGFVAKLNELGYDGYASLELEPGEGSVSTEEVRAAARYATNVLGIAGLQEPELLTQADVNTWLELFLSRLRERFGERVVFVAHHGSWARGEAHEDSDIDAFVILDRVDDETLAEYREVMESLPYTQEHMVSTFMGSAVELRAWPRHQQVECWYGCRTLHGNLADLVDPPTDADCIEDVSYKAAEALHMARHYLLHPHDMTGRARQLKYPFKECVYALQSWLLLTTGVRYDRKDELLAELDDPDDIAVVEAVRDWRHVADDSPETAVAYCRLLERWSRGMLGRLAAWEAEKENAPGGE